MGQAIDSVDIGFLAKGCQICAHFSRLLNAQAHRRHFATRFEYVGLVNPRNEASDIVLRRSRGDGLPAHEMRKIRTVSAFCRRARYRVAVHASRCLEDPLPWRHFAADMRRLALLLNP